MAASRMWLRNNLTIVRVQAAVFSHRRRTIMSNIGLSQKRLVIATVFLNAVAFAGAAHSSGAPPSADHVLLGSAPFRGSPFVSAAPSARSECVTKESLCRKNSRSVPTFHFSPRSLATAAPRPTRIARGRPIVHPIPRRAAENTGPIGVRWASRSTILAPPDASRPNE